MHRLRLGRLACVAAIIIPACSGGGVSDRVAKPEASEEWKAAAVVARKLLAHYGPDGLDRFTWKEPGSFQPLIDTGVLLKEDVGKIQQYGFQSFEFSRCVEFSRQYSFLIRTAPDQGMGVNLNHRGEPIREDGEQDRSIDLPADVNLTWSIDEKGHSTQDAILAGSRVFNTVDPIGMRRDEIVKLIGDSSRRPGGNYNFPFHPAGSGNLVYRFGNRAFGGQFNVKLGRSGTCIRVERLWIH